MQSRTFQIFGFLSFSVCLHGAALVYFSLCNFSYHPIEKKQIRHHKQECVKNKAVNPQKLLKGTLDRLLPNLMNGKGKHAPTSMAQDENPFPLSLGGQKTTHTPGNDPTPMTKTQLCALLPHLGSNAEPLDNGSVLEISLEAPLSLKEASICPTVEKEEEKIHQKYSAQPTQSFELFSSLAQLAQQACEESPYTIDTKSLSPPAGGKGFLEEPSLFLAQAFENEGDLIQSPGAPAALAKPQDANVSFEPPSFDLNDLCSDSFQMEAVCTPMQNSPKYAFEVVLHPQNESLNFSMPHHISFVIDRSHSIEKNLFRTFKRVISQAFYLLRPTDTFDVLFFDKKIHHLSSNPLAANRKNISRARGFLHIKEAGGIFASTNIEKVLQQTIKSTCPDNAAHTIILLSDGDHLLKPEQQLQIVKQVSKTNAGHASIYTAAMGKDNNLGLLTLLSQLNRGTLIYGPESAPFESSFLHLMRAIRFPIAKEMHVTLVPQDKSAHITVCSPSHRLPLLYANAPYVIRGTSDRPCTFTLFLQGQTATRPITIKKEITLIPKESTSDQTPSLCLNDEVILQKSLDHFESYFKKGDLRQLRDIQIAVPKQPT